MPSAQINCCSKLLASLLAPCFQSTFLFPLNIPAFVAALFLGSAKIRLFLPLFQILFLKNVLNANISAHKELTNHLKYKEIHRVFFLKINLKKIFILFIWPISGRGVLMVFFGLMTVHWYLRLIHNVTFIRFWVELPDS